MLRPQEVADGIARFPVRTPTLPPATHTQSYALGGREVLLIEPATPYADEQTAWLDWARNLRNSGRSLRAIVLTHHHIDHVGGAAELSRELGVPLWAHALTRERLPELRFERTLEDGEELVLDGPRAQSWRVLHTPGHAPGHVCLFEAEAGHVIVGDMVASEGTILIETHDGDMAEYLRQLARLEALGASTALPAHGDPIDQPAALFSHYLAHRLARESKVLDAVQASGPDGISDVAMLPTAYSDTPRQIWPLALLSVRAHLVKLVSEGRARTDGEKFWAT